MQTRTLSAKALRTRIKALTRKHRRIDNRIEMEQMRPHPDVVLVRQLKRERLGLKDALHSAKRHARQNDSSDVSLA